MKLKVILLMSVFMTQFSNAQDWAKLDYYKKENLEIGIPLNKEDRIVFMGNSITRGWTKHSPGFFPKHKNYINRGIGGQTTPQLLIRFRQDVIDLKPKVVVLMAGTNDIAQNTGVMTLEETFGNIKSMIELAKVYNIKVVLCSVLPAFDFPWRKGLEPAEKIYQLNGLLKKYADENKLVFLDYYSHMVNEQKGLKQEYTYDGVHPNEAGYHIMEPLVEDAIKSVLKEKNIRN